MDEQYHLLCFSNIIESIEYTTLSANWIIKSIKFRFLLTARGVRQGSILGPLHFSLVINDMLNSLKLMAFLLFANDAQVYRWTRHKSTYSLWLLIIKTRLILVKPLILPHFIFGCEVFSYGLDYCSNKPFNKAFQSVISYVFNLSKLGSTAAYIDQFLSCSLQGFFKVRAMCLIRKVMLFRESKNLRDAFQLAGWTTCLFLEMGLRWVTLFIRGVSDWTNNWRLKMKWK